MYGYFIQFVVLDVDLL